MNTMDVGGRFGEFGGLKKPFPSGFYRVLSFQRLVLSLSSQDACGSLSPTASFLPQPFSIWRTGGSFPFIQISRTFKHPVVTGDCASWLLFTKVEATSPAAGFAPSRPGVLGTELPAFPPWGRRNANFPLAVPPSPKTSGARVLL